MREEYQVFLGLGFRDRLYLN